jgi:protein-L-isoaspartate O-methyltransferase
MSTPASVATAQAGRQIDPAVLGILSRCRVEGMNVRLPDERLDRKLYQKVDEVLRALGGRWVGKKTMAHVFEESPAPVLDVALGTGTFTKPQDFGYFPTPPNLVEHILDMAALEPGMTVLEPSAGQGAIALAAAQRIGSIDLVTVCELLPGNAKKLREAGFAAVKEQDFLGVAPEPLYDRVVMNPPFSGSADVKHVMHAAKFLKPDGRLVAITSPSWDHNSFAISKEFKEFLGEAEASIQKVEAGAFRESGTEVATRIVAMNAANFPWNRQAPAAHNQMRQGC